MTEEHPDMDIGMVPEAELPGFGDTYGEVNEDFGSPLPAPPVKKERRYSGMEIPFGVVEAGTNVNELNPMVKRDSKRMSMLKPEIHHEDVPFGVDARSSMVADVNPMRKNSGKLSPLGVSTTPFAGDEVLFGTTEPATHTPTHMNPLRMSGKFSRTPSSSSPTKQTQDPSPTASPQRRLISRNDIAADVAHTVHIILLFFYILFEIVYEVARDITTPNAKKQ